MRLRVALDRHAHLPSPLSTFSVSRPLHQLSAALLLLLSSVLRLSLQSSAQSNDTNLLYNGGFELGGPYGLGSTDGWSGSWCEYTCGWSLGSSDGTYPGAHSGQSYFKVGFAAPLWYPGGGSYGGTAQQAVVVEPGATYQVGFWLKVGTDNNWVSVTVTCLYSSAPTSYLLVSNDLATADYTYYSYNVTAPMDGINAMQLSFDLSATNQYIGLDDVGPAGRAGQLQRASASRPVDGLVGPAAAGHSDTEQPGRCGHSGWC